MEEDEILRAVGVLGRIAPNRGTAAGFPVRLRSAKFYRCPACSGRTLLVPARLGHDADWKGPPSVFPRDLRARFDAFLPVSPPELTFDFHCQRCRRPVRLVYELMEVGMGGPWHPVVRCIVEVHAPART